MDQQYVNDASQPEADKAMEESAIHSDHSGSTAHSIMRPAVTGHMLAMDDPENPMNWPLRRKLHACAMGFSFTFVLLFGATCYTSALKGVQKEFGVSMEKAIAGFSIYIFGIFFAPLKSPHISERMGRTPQYFIAMFGNAIFTLGAAYSKTYTQLMVCRFFAGFTGGPAVVLIEGTFADVWPALYTGTYYSFLTCASYFGAGIGPVVGYPIVKAMNGNWRWTQYLTLLFSLAAFLISIGAPETYGRKILKAQAKRKGTGPIAPAPTGETVVQMTRLTVIDPLIMLVSEPLVIMISLFLALNFGVLFSWFITVPVVLSSVYNFTPHMIGYAFTSAIGGTFMAFLSTAAIDQVTVRLLLKKKSGNLDVEHRLIPAMVGGMLMIAALFWIGWEANPHINPVSPIIGTAFYVWGSAMSLIAFVGYLFDAYSPQGTLSALTAAACLRIALAGIIPLVIITAFTNLTGKWALAVFGFIFVGFLAFPFILFFFGAKMRKSSRYSGSDNMSPLQMQIMMKDESKSTEKGMNA